jgi:hypothetical protein
VVGDVAALVEIGLHGSVERGDRGSSQRVIAPLKRAFLDIPPERVAEVVCNAHRDFQHSPVRDFVPLLVEHIAHHKLCDQSIETINATIAAYRMRPSTVIQKWGSRWCVSASRRSGGSTRNRIGNIETARPTVTSTATSRPPPSANGFERTEQCRGEHDQHQHPHPRITGRFPWCVGVRIEEPDLEQKDTGDGRLDRKHRLVVLNRDIHDRPRGTSDVR